MLCSPSSRLGQAAGDAAECGMEIPTSFCLWRLPRYQEILEEFDICLPMIKLGLETVKNKLCCKLWGFVISLLVYKTDFLVCF